MQGKAGTRSRVRNAWAARGPGRRHGTHRPVAPPRRLDSESIRKSAEVTTLVALDDAVVERRHPPRRGPGRSRAARAAVPEVEEDDGARPASAPRSPARSASPSSRRRTTSANMSGLSANPRSRPRCAPSPCASHSTIGLTKATVPRQVRPAGTGASPRRRCRARPWRGRPRRRRRDPHRREVGDVEEDVGGVTPMP